MLSVIDETINFPIISTSQKANQNVVCSACKTLAAWICSLRAILLFFLALMLERFILWTLAPDDVEFAEEDLDEAGGEGDDDEDELSSRSRLFLPPVKNESSFVLKDTGSFRQRFLGDGGQADEGMFKLDTEDVDPARDELVSDRTREMDVLGRGAARLVSIGLNWRRKKTGQGREKYISTHQSS